MVSLLSDRARLLLFTTTVVMVNVAVLAERFRSGTPDVPALLTFAALVLIVVPCSLVAGGILGPRRSDRS